VNDFGQLQWFDRAGTARRDSPAALSGSGSNPVLANDGRIAWDRTAVATATCGFRRYPIDPADLRRAVDFLPIWLPAGDRTTWIETGVFSS
jgi:hypothetical protein